MFSVLLVDQRCSVSISGDADLIGLGTQVERIVEFYSVTSSRFLSPLIHDIPIAID